MGFEGGLLGLIILAIDIWAILQILKSSQTGGTKLFWILVIVMLPVLGLLIWLVAGRR